MASLTDCELSYEFTTPPRIFIDTLGDSRASDVDNKLPIRSSTEPRHQHIYDSAAKKTAPLTRTPCAHGR